jgi:hypothetical protein
MFFLIVIVLLVVFQSRSTQMEAGEMWFMMSVFVGLAYVAGFLDSRLFARMDKKNGNMLAEAEQRYEENINTPAVAEAND